MGLDAMIFLFWMLSFKPTFSLSSFTVIKKFFSSSSLSAIRVVSLHIWGKQGDSIQPWWTPFAIWKQSVVPCPVLTVASWPAYRFLKRQVRYSMLLCFFNQPFWFIYNEMYKFYFRVELVLKNAYIRIITLSRKDSVYFCYLQSFLMPNSNQFLLQNLRARLVWSALYCYR